MTATKVKHPAKFSAPIIAEVEAQLDEHDIYGFILDPFAGVGGVHALALNAPGKQRWTLGVELEPEWAECHEDTEVGDATDLYFVKTCSIDAVVTSPPYGNRFTDKDFRDSAAGNYAKCLGRVSSDGSANHRAFHTSEYRDIMERAIAEMLRVLKTNGWLFLNVSDFYRKDQLVPVTQWFKQTVEFAGFVLEGVVPIPTQRMTRGANRKRADHEDLIVAFKP